MWKLAIIFLMSVVLAACANRPDSIAAAIVPQEKYKAGDCTRLESQLSDAKAELEEVSEKQNSKATGDATSVALFGIPFSLFTGDYEKDVAKWKGEVEAIERAKTNRCPA